MSDSLPGYDPPSAQEVDCDSELLVTASMISVS